MRRLLACCAVIACASIAQADSLDSGVEQDAFLSQIGEALSAYDIDVTSNLNSRDVVGQRIRRARLGRFPDLPINSLPFSEEIENWENAYSESEIGGIAIVASDSNSSVDSQTFYEAWMSVTSDARLFVSFYQGDKDAAQKIADVANAYGLQTEMYFGGNSLTSAGQRYATASQRLAIDSRDARRYRTEVTELSFLGERVRRRSNSLFKEGEFQSAGALARTEPAAFLKETLGDEFNQSTISEIVVPGGVALGESAKLDFVPVELLYNDGRLVLRSEEGGLHTLPAIKAVHAKSLFDFVARSEETESDAIVDIDADRRVRISSALRDTDVGLTILHADTQPFEYVSNLRVTKSVIIDTAVQWRQGSLDESLEFETEFEVRFLSADNMRIAQTRVALQYDFDSKSEFAEYSDSWGRDVGRLDENLDYAGLGQSMTEVAGFAGWVGLFRRLQQDEVLFLQGRYEFMKLDKAGSRTPTRY